MRLPTEWAITFPHSCFWPPEIDLETQRKLPFITEELFPACPAFPFTILQLPWRTQRLARGWSPLLCLQVHQLCLSVGRPIPFYHPSPWPPFNERWPWLFGFGCWDVGRSSWGGCYSQSKRQSLSNRGSFFGPSFFFHLPAWNAQMGSRGGAAILQWIGNSYKDEKWSPAENMEQSWKTLGSLMTLTRAFMGCGPVISKIPKWCVILAVCYGLNVCVPPRFVCWDLISKMMVSGGGPLGGEWVMRAERSCMGLVPMRGSRKAP